MELARVASDGHWDVDETLAQATGPMDYLPAIFALLVAAAGWYYLFYSRAAQKLAGVEEQRQNRLRVRLRRVGGLVIMLLAVAFYAMFVMLRRQRFVAAGVLVLAVMVLMAAVMVLGLIDLGLTRKMRRDRPRPRLKDPLSDARPGSSPGSGPGSRQPPRPTSEQEVEP